MHISWLGNTTIRIQTKHNGQEIDIIIDPYKPAIGQFPRSITSDIALFTRGAADSITVSGTPFFIETPGEYEAKGVFIFCAPSRFGNIFYFESEQITCAHLGYCDKELNDRELSLVAEADILFVPVGGGDVASAETALKIVTQIEPRIVVPMCFQSIKEETWDKIDKFLKAMGASGAKPVPKLKISKKDLPAEETQAVVLERGS